MSLIGRYATALYQAVSEANNGEAERDVTVLRKVISQDKKFISLLLHPTEKRRLINKLTEGMSPLVVNLCKLLEKNQRIPMIPDIAEKFLQLIKGQRGEIDVNVTSTVPLSEQYIKRIKSFLNMNKIINIVNHIDRSILGGIVIKYHNKVLDLSSRLKLETLKKISKEEVLSCS